MDDTEFNFNDKLLAFKRSSSDMRKVAYLCVVLYIYSAVIDIKK